MRFIAARRRTGDANTGKRRQLLVPLQYVSCALHATCNNDDNDNERALLRFGSSRVVNVLRTAAPLNTARIRYEYDQLDNIIYDLSFIATKRDTVAVSAVLPLEWE